MGFNQQNVYDRKVSDFEEDIQSIEEQINEVTESDVMRITRDKFLHGEQDSQGEEEDDH